MKGDQIKIKIKASMVARALAEFSLAKVLKLGNVLGKRLLAFLLLILVLVPSLSITTSFAQVNVSEPSGNLPNVGSPNLGGGANRTQPTSRFFYPSNEWKNAINSAVPQNSSFIQREVSRLLKKDNWNGLNANGQSNDLTTAVFQAAESNRRGSPPNVSGLLSYSIGTDKGNWFYNALHQFWKDDIVDNLFGQVGQLIGKWLTEFINGWLVDTIRFLTKFLAVFVYNPNIPINGKDDISIMVKRTADVMYGIAIDLLLLLFILAIWKYWAEASWRGAGNLMGALGRLIFTAGLMLAWPTLYAFEIQITNEMIKAINFNGPNEVLMLDAALASAIRGGLVAIGGGLADAFAPILGALAGGAPGALVGQTFAFVGIVLFTVLSSVLVVELIYVLVLKSIQTALLTAQYMFAPIFLVFFATPDTEQTASGYVKAFVEVSLWTFMWLGLFKLMVIIMFSDFNPWGKILLSVGVLQIMIQVPGFLAQARISPVSAFLEGGLVIGGMLKMLNWMGERAQRGVGQLVDYHMNQKYGARGLQMSARTPINPKDQGIHTWYKGEKERKKAIEEEQKRKKQEGEGAGERPTTREPGLETGREGRRRKPRPGEASEATAGTEGPGTPPLRTPGEDPTAAAAGTGEADDATAAAAATTTRPAGRATPPRTGSPRRRGRAGSPAGRTGSPGGPGSPTVTTPGGGGMDPDDDFDEALYQLQQYNQATFDTRNLAAVGAFRGIVQAIKGIKVQFNRQGSDSALWGTSRDGTAVVGVDRNATPEQVARSTMIGGLSNEITNDPVAYDAARQAAIDAEEDGPRGIWENLAANWLQAHGHSFKQTARAKERFNKALHKHATLGTQAFLHNDADGANAYSAYLTSRYGPWTEDRDRYAIQSLTDPDFAEGQWNPMMGPATDMLLAMGIPINSDTRIGLQNSTIWGMHRSRQKPALLAAMRCTYGPAQEQFRALYPESDPRFAHLYNNGEIDATSGEFRILHGEMTMALPEADVLAAMEISPYSGGRDLNKPILDAVNQISAQAGISRGSAYQTLCNVTPQMAADQGLVGTADPTQMRRLGHVLHAMNAAGTGDDFGQVLADSQNAVRILNAHGITSQELADPNFAGNLHDFVATHGGTWDVIGTVDQPQLENALGAAGNVVRQFGTAGWTQSRAFAVLDNVRNGGRGNLTQSGIMAAEAIIDGGGHARDSMIGTYVALHADPTVTAMGPINIGDVESVADYVDAGTGPLQRAPVMYKMHCQGIPINQNTLPLGAELDRTDSLTADNMNAGITTGARCSVSPTEGYQAFQMMVPNVTPVGPPPGGAVPVVTPEISQHAMGALGAAAANGISIAQYVRDPVYRANTNNFVESEVPGGWLAINGTPDEVRQLNNSLRAAAATFDKCGGAAAFTLDLARGALAQINANPQGTVLSPQSIYAAADITAVPGGFRATESMTGVHLRLQTNPIFAGAPPTIQEEAVVASHIDAGAARLDQSALLLKMHRADPNMPVNTRTVLAAGNLDHFGSLTKDSFYATMEVSGSCNMTPLEASGALRIMAVPIAQAHGTPLLPNTPIPVTILQEATTFLAAAENAGISVKALTNNGTLRTKVTDFAIAKVGGWTAVNDAAQKANLDNALHAVAATLDNCGGPAAFTTELANGAFKIISNNPQGGVRLSRPVLEGAAVIIHEAPAEKLDAPLLESYVRLDNIPNQATRVAHSQRVATVLRAGVGKLEDIPLIHEMQQQDVTVDANSLKFARIERAANAGSNYKAAVDAEVLMVNGGIDGRTAPTILNTMILDEASNNPLLAIPAHLNNEQRVSFYKQNHASELAHMAQEAVALKQAAGFSEVQLADPRLMDLVMDIKRDPSALAYPERAIPRLQAIAVAARNHGAPAVSDFIQHQPNPNEMLDTYHEMLTNGWKPEQIDLRSYYAAHAIRDQRVHNLAVANAVPAPAGTTTIDAADVRANRDAVKTLMRDPNFGMEVDQVWADHRSISGINPVPHTLEIPDTLWHEIKYGP